MCVDLFKKFFSLLSFVFLTASADQISASNVDQEDLARIINPSVLTTIRCKTGSLSHHTYTHNLVMQSDKMMIRAFYERQDIPFFVARKEGKYIPAFFLGTYHTLPDTILPGYIRWIAWKLNNCNDAIFFSEQGIGNEDEDLLEHFSSDLVEGLPAVPFSVEEVEEFEGNYKIKNPENTFFPLPISAKEYFAEHEGWMSTNHLALEGIKKSLAILGENDPNFSLEKICGTLGKLSPYAVYVYMESKFYETDMENMFCIGMDENLENICRSKLWRLDDDSHTRVAERQLFESNYQNATNCHSFGWAVGGIEYYLRNIVGAIKLIDIIEVSTIDYRDIALTGPKITELYLPPELEPCNGFDVRNIVHDESVAERNKLWVKKLYRPLSKAEDQDCSQKVFTFVGAGHFEGKDSLNELLQKKMGLELVKVTPDMFEEMLELINGGSADGNANSNAW